MNLTDHIESIYLKTKQLALKVERLEKENKALKKENQALKTDLESRMEKVRELETRIGKLALQQETNLPPEVREQIGQYIQEIDKCIEWLQKQ